ncbi:condensation domain-containing protein [Apodospora peruviana]|uniref:Condensation domain-containing protein n=1 Tax=Apodospora peruviana TaxID=516989 RepID=A0AAE0LZB8_9PEZI|nr:condensation domain-containing protein [Apodospora peruviana]
MAPMKIQPYGLLDGDKNEKLRLITECCRQCGIIDTRLIKDVYPCTPTQELLIESMQRIVYGKPAAKKFPVPWKYKHSLRGDVSVSTFRRAWQNVVNIYPILRTRIIMDRGRHYQVVVREIEEAVSGLFCPAVHHDNHSKNDFDYGERLCREAVILGTPSRPTKYFVLTLNHAIHDARVLDLVLGDLVRGYHMLESQSGGRLVTTNQLFNVFVKHTLEVRNNESSHHFWRTHLEGAVCHPLYALAIRFHPPEAFFPGALKSFQLNTRTSRYVALPSLTPRPHTRDEIAICGSLGLVLGALTGSPDIVFDLVRSGRDCLVPPVASMVAPAATHCPLRIHVKREAGRTVGQFLHQIYRNLWDMVESDYQFTGWPTIRALSKEAENAFKSAYPLQIIPCHNNKNKYGIVQCKYQT